MSMSVDGSRRWTGIPCHEYLVCNFDQGSLGFDMCEIDKSKHPVLGTAVLASVVKGGQAEREGLRPLDVIVALNDVYIAFMTFTMIRERLQNAPRPMVVIFARPWRNAWERISKDIEGVVKMGTLEKYGGAAFLGRWQSREFTLTRTTLSYSDEGVLRKKIPLEEIVQVIPGLQENEFALMHQGKELKLKCPNAEEKIRWAHAIETTKKGCFDNAQRVLQLVDAFANGGPATSSAVPGASAVVAPPVPVKKAPPKPPVNKGPYHLLGKSLVLIKADADFDENEMTLPPPVIVRNFAPLDLSLEKKLLGT